jgi:hypothetical protein
MKDLTLSVASVIVLALLLGLAFHWIYPLVELTGELAGLFTFIALVIKLVAGRLWSLLRRPVAPPGAEAGK